MARSENTETVTAVIDRLRSKMPTHQEKAIKVQVADPRLYVEPYLPPLAKSLIKNHQFFKTEDGQKKAAFVRAISHNPGQLEYCPNCGGGGWIYVTLCDSGPHRYILTTKKPVTWFDGDGIFGKGWYVVDKTTPFECPECNKKGEK